MLHLDRLSDEELRKLKGVIESANADVPLTPRQRLLGQLLADLLIADYRAFPPASVGTSSKSEEK